MRLLLDTHALLWALGDPDELEPAARSAIADPANTVFVSAASTWEIAIKRAQGKLKAPVDVAVALRDASFTSLSVTVDHSLAAGALPLHHRDPFDRMLVAQAQIEQLSIVTRDGHFELYGASVLPA